MAKKLEVVEVSETESKEAKIKELKALIEGTESTLAGLKKELRELGGAKTRVNVGVKDFVKPLIEQGLTNKEILTKVHEHYGNENTTYACIAWYRNNMKQA